MPYDPSKKPAFAETDEDTFSHVCTAITPNDSADATDPSGAYFKYIVAATDGDVAFLGYRNLDGDSPGVMTVLAGQVLPGRIRRILATGTTATVQGWSD